jgi:predicted dehydrogenase
MINERSPDYVLVALPHHAYPSVIEFCLRRGLKVIKEKPFATALEQVEHLSKTVAETPGTLFTVCQKRYYPAYEELRRYIDCRPGQIRQVVVRYTIPSKSPNSGWRGRSDKAGGGVWLDMGYHAVNLLQFLLRSPAMTVSHASLINTAPGSYEVDDIAFAELNCAGIPALVYVSCVDSEKNEHITITGDDFIARADRRGLLIKNKNQDTLLVSNIEADPGSPFTAMYKQLSLDIDGAIFAENLSESIQSSKIICEVNERWKREEEMENV